MQTSAPLMLSVSGARGIVGESMTPEVAANFARAFASHIIEDSKRDVLTLCIGRDSRPSGAQLARAVIEALKPYCATIHDLGIVATPTAGTMVQHLNTDGAIILTASHNPTEWNGIKCIDARGCAPRKEEAQRVIRRFEEQDFIPPRRMEGASQHDCVVHQIDNPHRVHIERVLNLIDVDAIRNAHFSVALDSINGAGCVGGRALLEALGCKVVHINDEPNGLFAHRPEPTETNLAEFAASVAEHDVTVGFAQDPDADRLAIIDEQGRYIGEEFTLVIAAQRWLQTQGPTPIVVNLSTSRMIEDVAANITGAKVMHSPVGEANVAEMMRVAGAAIGGEGNGGVIIPSIGWIRDSLGAMALVLSLLAEQRRPLSEIVADLPRYDMIKHSFDLQSIGGPDAVGPALEQIKTAFADFDMNTSDGVRINFADGWVHLRPSNTEPILRLIAEASSSSKAWELIDEVAVAANLK